MPWARPKKWQKGQKPKKKFFQKFSEDEHRLSITWASEVFTSHKWTGVSLGCFTFNMNSQTVYFTTSWLCLHSGHGPIYKEERKQQNQRKDEWLLTFYGKRELQTGWWMTEFFYLGDESWYWRQKVKKTTCYHLYTCGDTGRVNENVWQTEDVISQYQCGLTEEQ